MARLHLGHDRPSQGSDAHSREARRDVLRVLADVNPVSPGEALLHAAPMSHGSGLYMIAQVFRRAVNVIPESGGFDAGKTLAIATTRSRVSMFAAPTMIKRIVRDAPGSRVPAFER